MDMLSESDIRRLVPSDDPELTALNARGFEPARRIALGPHS
jgi:hypothetical protein